MTRLTTTSRAIDQNRAYRLMAAWCTGDRLGADTVLGETMADPIGTPGLLFTLVEFATSLGEQVAPDFVSQLRSNLVALEVEDG